MLHQSNYQARDTLGRFTSEGRTERLSIRLTPQELSDLRYAAESRHMSMTKFIAFCGTIDAAEARRLRPPGNMAARVTARGGNSRS